MSSRREPIALAREILETYLLRLLIRNWLARRPKICRTALWSMDTLAEYVRKHAVEKQFGDELAKASKSTIWFILDSDETERNYGIFCLVNNKHKDPWVVLKRYRMRNRIEESYRVSKSEFDGDRARVWNVRKVRGKELCRMVALGYHLSTKCDSKRPGLPPTRTLRYKIARPTTACGSGPEDALFRRSANLWCQGFGRDPSGGRL